MADLLGKAKVATTWMRWDAMDIAILMVRRVDASHRLVGSREEVKHA